VLTFLSAGTIVERGCASELSIWDPEAGCDMNSGVENCFCDGGDFCNGAVVKISTIQMVISSVTIAITFNL
jgi:hypothetical protein